MTNTAKANGSLGITAISLVHFLSVPHIEEVFKKMKLSQRVWLPLPGSAAQDAICVMVGQSVLPTNIYITLSYPKTFPFSHRPQTSNRGDHQAASCIHILQLHIKNPTEDPESCLALFAPLAGMVQESALLVSA